MAKVGLHIYHICDVYFFHDHMHNQRPCKLLHHNYIFYGIVLSVQHGPSAGTVGD